jgi:malic enzyme
MEIFRNVEDVYKYTAKGNLVAVISNGTAVLGLGDIGPEAGKTGDGRQGRIVQNIRGHRCI